MTINTIPEVKILKLKDIKPDPANPREISPEAMAGLRESLTAFGLVDLMIINKRGMRIINGHQRYRVLKEEGAVEALCVLVDADKIQAQMINISLNNQRIMGFWTESLIPILEKLRREYPEQYLKLKLEQLREDVRHMEQENLGAGKLLPDDIPEPPAEARTKPGDLWILGDHKLLCGDSRNREDVDRLFGKEQASLLATDPPYFVDYTGTARPNGGKDWSRLYNEVDIKDVPEFLSDFLTCGLRHTKEKAGIYVWHASNRDQIVKKALKELGILVHQTIIWVKPCVIMGFSFYPYRHEPCLFGWREGSKPFYRVDEKQVSTVWSLGFMRKGDPTKPEYYTDVWELDYDGKKRNTGAEHPTVKPTEVFAIPMRVHTKPGDICYEPFCGSGSEIIAGERLNRRVFAIEKTPWFVDLSVKRWEEFTGKKAVLKRK